MIRPLTERQEQVVDGIRRGLEYGEIAAELGISDRTVEGHVIAIMNVIPNEDGHDPYLAIFLFANHREWLLSLVERDAKEQCNGETRRSGEAVPAGEDRRGRRDEAAAIHPAQRSIPTRRAV